MEGEDRRRFVADVATAAVYAVAIGLNAALIVDELTGGAIRRRVALWLTGWGRRREQAREFRRAVAHVLWEAHEATLEASETEGD